MIQLPEPVDNNTETGKNAIKLGLKTIADITKERVRRVIKKFNGADAGKMNLDGDQKHDLGFRVFKLAESNFKAWNVQGAKDAQALEKQLEMHIKHIRADRNSRDILYEIILKSGFPLTTPVQEVDLAGKKAYSIAGGALYVCLEHELTLDLIRAMAKKKPERIVCLDEGFAGNDQLKANAVQVFKTKGITSFKTI